MTATFCSSCVALARLARASSLSAGVSSSCAFFRRERLPLLLDELLARAGQHAVELRTQIGDFFFQLVAASPSCSLTPVECSIS